MSSVGLNLQTTITLVFNDLRILFECFTVFYCYDYLTELDILEIVIADATKFGFVSNKKNIRPYYLITFATRYNAYLY